MTERTSTGEPIDPERQTWDAIVVGAGMGGGTLGYALAAAGQKVLFVEKGASTLFSNPSAIRGCYPDDVLHFDRLPQAEQVRQLVAAGRSVDEIEDVSGRKRRHYHAMIGGGVGGSSALYGMACERLFPSDFTPRAAHIDADGSTLPEAWPISYQQLAPWYTAAEKLYRVRGTPDPLRPAHEAEHLLPPPPTTPGNAELAEHFAAHGLHPYRIHLACEHLPQCHTCQGILCAQPCKNDAGRICVGPAVEQHGAALMTGAVALKLEADRTRVTEVVCDWRGKKIALRGKQVVLAAGGLYTPLLLLNSKSADWPQGLANDSGQVGRNLMRHCIDLVILKAKSIPDTGGEVRDKEICFNDWYDGPLGKLGTIQSLGPIPPLGFLLNQPAFQGLQWSRPVAMRLWRSITTRAIVLAAIMEDLPYADNFLVPASPPITPEGRQQVQMSFHLRAPEQRRLKVFQHELRRVLRAYKPIQLRAATDNTAIAHITGTCRFGGDPRTSVLDPCNRAHGLDNLYVVDASFFPTSGGINPSLTIAANALRVADQLLERR